MSDTDPDPRGGMEWPLDHAADRAAEAAETARAAEAGDRDVDGEITREPTTTELTEPSTEKDPGEEPKAPNPEQPTAPHPDVPSHEAVCIEAFTDDTEAAGAADAAIPASTLPSPRLIEDTAGHPYML
ncbi:hypothetical protein [Microbacterium sp.]|uniref:hypothetical protein n=1 Tax=Microbacterium sp. TaxID=51671 RepID=UPI0039E667C0